MNTITTQDTTRVQDATPGRRNHRSVAVIASACVACAALATAAVIAVAHSNNASAGTPTMPAPGVSAPVSPGTGSGTPAVTPSHPVTPPAHPSAAVVKLQQELAQLNYYQGPADGITGPQTIDAIRYLQRDAHLPQTGQMNAATQAALANFLAHGNNQMGGN